MSHIIVFTTCPNNESAEQLATLLVEQRLAACVNLLPGIRSIYRWQGQVMKEGEILLLIKSHTDHFAAVKEALLQRHPYELPEVVAVSITDGHDPYLAWIDSQLEKQQ